MTKRDPHSIHAEPKWNRGKTPGDSSLEDSVYLEPSLNGRPVNVGDEERANHNVWDELASVAGGVEAPEGAITFARWYQAGLERVSFAEAWSVTLLLALVGGPLAFLGAVLPIEPTGMWSYLAVVSIGPVMEEMLKISAVAIAIERWPYLFRSSIQVFIAVLASAAFFSVVENLLYLYVWIPDPSPAIIAWRWSVCTALHIGATAVAGLGIAKMWRVSRTRMQRAQMQDAFPYVVAAILIHCVYNGLAVSYEAVFEPF